MQNETLILAGEGYNLSIAPEAEAEKAALLKNSALLVTVADELSSNAAAAQLKLLSSMRNMVEKSRNTVKAPVLRVGKDIDAKAAEFVAEITAEENRLKKLQGAYGEMVIAERNRILAELRAKEAAEAKARYEAEMEAKRKADEAEKARRDAEAAEWDAVTPEEEAEAKRKVLAAEEARRKVLAAEETEAARLAAQAEPTTFVPVAPRGVKMVADYELTDIDALYRHNAGLVNMTERRKEILEAIARGMIGDAPPQIPGLRVFMKAQVR